jgi:hypothetical protein
MPRRRRLPRKGSLRRAGFGDPDLWRQRKQHLDLGKQVIDLTKAIGLTPAGRSALGVAEVTTQENLADLHDLGVPTLVSVDEHLLDRPVDELTARTIDTTGDGTSVT